MSKIRALLKRFIPEKYRTDLKYTILRIKYSGRNYHCPVCRSYTRIQKPLGFEFDVIREKQIVGAGVRIALCPICNASDRIRLLFLFLKYKTGLYTEPTRLLHFAPEPALEHILKKQKNIDYLTADLYQEGVMQKIDITAIPYPDQSFDAIICNHVLEHIPDDKKAMHELYRVLSKGGWAVLQVPASKILEKTEEDATVIEPADRERIFGHRDHVRIYGRDYPDRLRQAGFKVEKFSWVEETGPEFRDPNFNLNKDEVIYFCRK